MLLYIIVSAVVLILVSIAIIYFVSKREKYSSSSMTNIGSFDNIVGKRVQPQPSNKTYNPYFPIKREKYVPTQNQSQPNWNQKQTIDRLDSSKSVELPIISSSTTPYNVDVADPTAYSFQVQAPRVIRKDPLAMLADPFRGDIPITMYPDVPIVERSKYGRDSLRLDGMFSDALSDKYRKLTGQDAVYFDMPTRMSHGASITS
jgi:hypothetical protein